MAKLVHEIWEQIDDRGQMLPGLGLAGPDGEGFRELLHEDARCVRRFGAESHFEAMTIYYRHYGWSEYTTDFASDRDPCPDDWAQRQTLGTN